VIDEERLINSPYKISITTFLAMFVRNAGSFYSTKEANSFLGLASNNLELFIPFFKWFDQKGKIRKIALDNFYKLLKGFGMTDIRSVHAGYSGQGFLLSRFFMNPADPRVSKQTSERIYREIELLGIIKRELKIEHPVLYVLHAGRKEKGISRAESVQSLVAVVRSVMEVAQKSGVCVTIENVFSYPGEEALGTILDEVADVLKQIGTEWIDKGVLGWTFDPAHALIAYSGNYDAIERDIKSILPFCNLIHVNHPKTTQKRRGEFLSQWGTGDDNHTAPLKIPRRTRYWNLMKEVILNSKISSLFTVTYEVNWAIPGLGFIFGGSKLSEVRLGLLALDRFCNHPQERFDVPAIERYIDAHIA